MDVTGIVLAAGAGSRAGGPKALRRRPDGTSWIAAACEALLAGGCSRVVVVLGAGAEAAHDLVPGPVSAPSVSAGRTATAATPSVRVVVAEDWAVGMSASLRAGLAAASGDAVLVTLVDLPTLPAAVVERVLAVGGLAQAVFDGRPGHPVLIPASAWSAVAESLAGDHGARAYLVAHDVTEVECGDLWDGMDIDRLES